MEHTRSKGKEPLVLGWLLLVTGASLLSAPCRIGYGSDSGPRPMLANCFITKAMLAFSCSVSSCLGQS